MGNQSRNWTPEEEQELRNLADQGLSKQEIANKLNRTFQSINKKAQHMRIKVKGSREMWTDKDIQKLIELWKDDQKTISSITRALNRSEIAVTQKAKQLGLGRRREYIKSIGIGDIALEMGVGRDAVSYWIKYKGLPARKRKIGHTIYHIDIDELLDWLFNNQDMFNASIMTDNLFTYEPDWLKQKRKEDTLKYKVKDRQPWSKEDDKTLLSLIQLGKDWDYIRKKLGRGKAACRDRAGELGYAIFRPKFWQLEELDLLRKESEYLTINELSKLLPRRSESAIEAKLKELGVKYHFKKELCKVKGEESHDKKR